MSSLEEKQGTRELPSDEILLGMKSGGNLLVVPKDVKGSKPSEQAGGRLYIDDMPAIEDLLARYEIVTAVMHKPAPNFDLSEHRAEHKSERSESREPDPTDDVSHTYAEHRPPFGPVLLIGGIPSATFAVGLLMLIGALIGAPVVTNAYIGLLLFFGGLGLGIVARIALYEKQGV